MPFLPLAPQFTERMKTVHTSCDPGKLPRKEPVFVICYMTYTCPNYKEAFEINRHYFSCTINLDDSMNLYKPAVD